MQPLMPVLISFLLSLGIVLAADSIITHLRRRAKSTSHASKPELEERSADGSTD